MDWSLRKTLAVVIALVFAIGGAPVAVAEGAPSFEETLQRAAAAYDAGEYEEALVHYARAREIQDHPQLQLQVAVLHAKLGECTAALLLYEKVVEAPDVSDEVRERAEDGVSNHEECKASSAAASTPSTGDDNTSSSHATATSAPDPKQKSRRTRRRIGWGLIGLSGATFLTGAVVASGRTARPGSVACYENGVGSGDCIVIAFDDGDIVSSDEAFEVSERAVRRSRAVAIVALGASVVSLTTGIVLLLTSREPAVSVGFTPTGVAVFGRW